LGCIYCFGHRLANVIAVESGSNNHMQLIREARAKDFDRIVEIEKAAFGSGLNARPQIKQLLEIFPEGLLVDWRQRGYIMAVTVEKRHNISTFDRCTGIDKLYIVNMAVDPAHQRKGIAKRLLAAILEKFKIPAMLTVEPENDNAISLYRQFGFRKDGIARRHFQQKPSEPCTDGWIMTRPTTYKIPEPS
jgi:ribosomal protein S18 acetylase RimI-like enzyme